MGYLLGVDVGTTFTAAATWRRRDGRAEVVALGDRANSIPSVLFLRPDGQWLVGEAANRRAVGEPDRVAREFKRRVGDRVPIMVGGRPFAPHTLVGVLLAWVVDQVSQREGSPPERLVVTCPANWGEYRRGLLVEAARQAGLGEVALLSEPVAAATWYASLERLASGALVGVYDLGGGTFDAAVLRTTTDDTANGSASFELCGDPAGDEQLGGVDFDQAILEHVAAVVGQPWSALDLAHPAVLSAVAQVRAAVTDAKESLSADLDVAIPVVVPGWTGQVRLTRTELEEAIRPALDQTLATFEQALRTAKVTPEQLHAVLLAGGSSRIPLVAELLTRRLGVQVALDAHPKFAVCQGAAVAVALQFGLHTRPTGVPSTAAESTAAESTAAESTAAESTAAESTSAPSADVAPTGRTVHGPAMPRLRRRLGLVLAAVLGFSGIVALIRYVPDTPDNPPATTIAGTATMTASTLATSTTIVVIGDERKTAALVFQDQFADASAAWDTTDDATRQQRYRGGAYEIVARENGDLVGFPRAQTELSWPGYALVKVEARRRAGDESDGYGIVCRYQDSANHYRLNITNDGYFGINKVLDGNVTALQRPRHSDAMSASSPNRIEALCAQGSGPTRLRLSVNGRQVAEVIDGERPLAGGGRVGVYGRNRGTGPSSWVFDNFTVWRV